jgi:hypothetical protein
VSTDWRLVADAIREAWERQPAQLGKTKRRLIEEWEDMLETDLMLAVRSVVEQSNAAFDLQCFILGLPKETS